MAPTAIQKLERERDSIKTTVAWTESKVQDHATIPLTQAKVEYYLTIVNNLHEKITQNHEGVCTLAPADIDLFNAEYVKLLDSVSDLQCSLHEIKQTFAAPASSSVPAPTSSLPTDIRLPRLELPSFNGKLNEWMAFRDLFVSAVHNNSNLSKAQKLTYLKTALTGEAAMQTRSLTLSDANYDIAWAQLKERYQNDRELLFTILHRFIGQPVIQSGSSSSLRSLIDISKECFRSLEVLKRPIDHWDDILLFHVFQKLDHSTKELWEQSLKDSSIPLLKTLFDFLEQRARALAAGGMGITKSSKSDGQQQRRVSQVHHLQTPPCRVCSSNHPIYRCSKFIEMTVSERTEVIKKHSICFNCLREGHSISRCSHPGTCKICALKHNTLLHRQNSTNSTAKDKQAAPLVLNHHSNDEAVIKQTILATAIIKVQDSLGQQKPVRVLLDGGSTSSFISESCVQKLGLRRTFTSTEVTGLGVVSMGITKGITAAVIRPHFESSNTYVVNCLIMPKVTGNLPIQLCDPTVWPHLQGLQLADPTFHQPSRIDMLLGADIFWNLLLEGRKMGSSDTPVAIKSTLGWLIAGNLNSVSTEVVTHHADADLNACLQRFWEIESVPTIRLLTQEEEMCEADFQTKHQRDETGRFVVCLPKKQPEMTLGQSRDMAVRRFKQLERRFSRNPEIHKQYIAFMNEYLSLGHMRVLSEEEFQTPSHPTCYIPHHFVCKESSTTTKLRVVFDASAKTSNGVSLNDTLLVGPTLQESLISILMRFRTHVVVFTADVAKMYRQINVAEPDNELQRIVWREDSTHPIKDFKLLTVTYGTASAPYLATKALQQLAMDEVRSLPLASKVALNDFYVDDLMSGSPTVEDALEVQSQLQELMKRGGLNLRKWSSNSPEVLQALPPDQRESQALVKIDADPTIKTLGVYWNPVQDVFTFKVTSSNQTPSSQLTKRILLSEVAKIFDPLGWLSPIIISAKIIIQQLWKLQTGWDDFLPEQIQQEWLAFRDNLFHIENISINRGMIPNSIHDIHLVGFCDASEKAYAAVVYLCVYSNNTSPVISLISSKTRVAPAKKISLPRLELCGAVLLSQLMTSIHNSLKITVNKQSAWTDSTVVLAWIQAHPSRWKTFIANRVTEIQAQVPATLWGHVKGTENPADCASRGLNPTELNNHPLWWHGPHWLMNGVPTATTTKIEDCDDILCEERKSVVCGTAIVTDLSLFNRYSKLQTLKRVTAWLNRFYNNCKLKCQAKKTMSHVQLQLGPLTADEINSALLQLVRCVQLQAFQKEIHCLEKNHQLPVKSSILSLHPFLDSTHIVRVGGRLRNAALPTNQKTPMLLPRHHRFTQLLISSEHLKNHHAGTQLLLSTLQQIFWIIRGKDAVRHQITKCVVCTRHKATTAQQLMGDLPSVRVTPARPFTKCGIDYAGPFSLRAIPSRSKVTFKAYLAIFVCFTTRAIHLEVVSSLSTDAFLAAMKRFIARRGLPSDIYSDCGTNFVGAANELKEVRALLTSSTHNKKIADKISEDGVQWHFNPPGAPHFGGLWEAGVKSTKFHLHRVLGSARLTYEEMTTVIHQIEACLNSRPLTAISTDPTDFSALTPGHFLVGGPLTAAPEYDLTMEKTGRLSRWQLLQQLNQHFWKRWSNEYLTRLQQRPKWLQQRANLNLNDLVLIKDDRLPPLKWKLGRVTHLHPGQDGLTRVVTIATAEGEFTRPIVKVCLLPINQEQ